MIKETVKQYSVATVTALGLAVGLGLYLTARRGYFDLSIINKSLASASLLLLGIVLLLGPLSRLYQRFDKWVNYRKELGVLAFFLGAAHVYMAMFPLAKTGPWGFYQAKPLAAYPGLLGLVIMLILFILSFEIMKKKLGAERWWKAHYRGVRIAALAVLFHMSVLKYSEWLKWLSGETGKLTQPGWPPASLLVAVFSGLVLLVRLAEIFGLRAAKALVPIFALTAAGITGWFFLR